mmetsp:Transcript_107494/g.213462  ORF Transcript_107494/g.213462 Transcript_107494/m.213462 type:complete len:286 (+) Transcript_107494:112-969(+)
MVGCAGSELAEEFGRRLKLKNCTISYVDDADMPRWGQLGCQGFIILDGSGSVVCKTTPAFLDVEALAFRYVETILGALLDSRPPPAILPGVMVRINGLQGAPELNGKQGMCVEAAGDNGRCVVGLSSRQTMSVKAENLTAINAPAVCAGASGGGCGGCKPCAPAAPAVSSGGCDDGGCKEQASPTESTDGRSVSRGASSENSNESIMKELEASQAGAKATDKIQKKEAFKGGVSMGICANEKCLCAECDCGAGCQCNIAAVSVDQEGTCEQCTEFRAEKAAQQKQ